jgi:CO/xanthine dehydrogenase FAD-binding subunit
MGYNVQILQPATLREVWRSLPAIRVPRAFLAGGTDLVVRAKHVGDVPPIWIDLSRLSELKRLEEKKDHIFIGSRVTYADLERSAVVRQWLPALYGVWSEFASPPVRSLATLGGNCANGSPAGDGIPALFAEEAVVMLERFGKKRDVPIDKFFLGPRRTVLQTDELIVGFKLPKWPGHRGAFLKLAPRKGLAIAKAAVAAAAEFSGEKVIKARVALGAVGPTVARVRDLEDFLAGKALTADVLKEAERMASAAARPITDHRSTAEYRKAMAGVLTRRALHKISTQV